MRIRRSPWKAIVASCLTLAAALAGWASPTADGATKTLVALGDSYSSGTGAGSYLADGTGCYRSLGTYSGVIAGQYGLALNLQACSGAVTNDVLDRQLGALGSSTSYVTISIGGNDVGFADVVTECAKPGWMGDCDGAITRALWIAENDLPTRLDRVYSAIRSRAPYAKVVVAGYPRLFNGSDCHIATFFSGSEMSRLNSAADRLSQITAAAAAKRGFSYADVRSPFVGHAVCDSAEWIHNVRITNITESFHPKSTGYRSGYAPVVANRLGLGAGTLSTRATNVRVTTGGTTSSDTTRGRFVAPDLTSAEARAAARRAGVSPAELEAMVRAQRSGAGNAQLERMSEAATR